MLPQLVEAIGQINLVSVEFGDRRDHSRWKLAAEAIDHMFQQSMLDRDQTEHLRCGDWSQRIEFATVLIVRINFAIGICVIAGCLLLIQHCALLSPRQTT